MSTFRPAYHFSVPDNWKNDPQRPVYVNGEYLYYYLYNADYIFPGEIGTAWRLATTTDQVAFKDAGVAIPKLSDANGSVMSGSVVVDEFDTAGYGAGALIAIVTQAPGEVQAQYLWYSTDKGRTFQAGSPEPVLPNPGVFDFRDPKVIWDTERGRWVMANAEGNRIGFYSSPDLHTWTGLGGFVRNDMGLLECPDLFTMEADDGSTHWILGISANAKHQGLPATYAYWVGAFDGITFIASHDEPLWLDYGFDFYGAVTYPSHNEDGVVDPTIRHALGWANFWDYPHNTPTTVTDGYNGDDMIVRDLRLIRRPDGSYALASTPTAALADYVTDTHALGDVTVADHRDLEVAERAHRITCEILWNPGSAPSDVGLEVGRAPGGARRVVVGYDVSERLAYVDRRDSFNPTSGRTQAPLDVTDGSLSLTVLVDRTSVEVFFGDGQVVHSHRVFPLDSDNQIRLYARGGRAVFADLTVATLGEVFSLKRSDPQCDRRIR